MKRTIILAALLPFVLAGCISFDKENNDLKEQVAQLQKDVSELQEAVGINHAGGTAATDSVRNAGGSAKSSDSQSKEQNAVNAVKYCLGKYKSDLKYDKITSMPKSDGTVDVIIDYKDCGDTRHTYYNLSVYSNGEFCVEDISGWSTGRFPYGDKFFIE